MMGSMRKLWLWGHLVGLLIVGLFVFADCRPTFQKRLKIPILEKSQMCRCVNRPDYNDNTKTDFTPPPSPQIWSIKNQEIDHGTYPSKSIAHGFNWVPDYAACAHFVQNIPQGTADCQADEVFIQALNEHGWPTGRWTTADQVITVCKDAGGSLTNIVQWKFQYGSGKGSADLFLYEKCYEDDFLDGLNEGWHTEDKSSIDEYNPHLLHLWPIFATNGMSGVTPLFYVTYGANIEKRPKKLKFVAELVWNTNKDKMWRVESPTYDVAYDQSTFQIRLTPNMNPTEEIIWNPDYYYQVRPPRNPAPICLKEKPALPPAPEFTDIGCKCFLHGRQEMLNTGTPFKDQPRLKLEDVIPKFPTTDLELGKIQGSGRKEDWEELMLLFHPKPPGTPKEYMLYHIILANPSQGIDNDLLVIFYNYLPVYKDRKHKEREVVITAFSKDGSDPYKGYPVGKFLDPYLDADKDKYVDACDQGATAKSVKWTKPAFPAIVDCKLVVDPFKTDEPNCFHFHSDYFFNECVEECQDFKWICAVWTHKELQQPPKKDVVTFQFISTSVYYHKKPYIAPVVIILKPDPCDSTDPWNMMQHIPEGNKAFRKHLEVFEYNANGSPTKIIHRSLSPPGTLLGFNDTYVTNEALATDKCVPPATFFTEVKDNNLCLCTFWKENIHTWRYHYGRMSSCGTQSKLSDFFKIDVLPTQNQDAVTVRVQYDQPDPKDFVMHAVYIQGMDQFGIPTGRFDPGFTIRNPDCPQNMYPTSTGLGMQHKLFDVRECPSVDAPNIDSNPSKYGIRVHQAANIWMMQNVWRDVKYTTACGTFKYELQQQPTHVTHIQFLAFVRVEDVVSRTPYFIEIRSPVLDAKDFRTPGIQDFPKKGTAEDRSVQSYIPLNYNYYRNTLTEATNQFERECLPPVKDPKRIYSLCRYYMSTPAVILEGDCKTNHRIDLDTGLNEYNQLCMSYLRAFQHVGRSHPYTTQLEDKRKTLKSCRDKYAEWKKCFELKAFKTRRRNAWHVKFRIKDNPDYCRDFNSRVKEAAIVAYNEEGFPTGRPGHETGGSFELYNHDHTKVNGFHEHCDDDDIRLTVDDYVKNEKMVFNGKKAHCWFRANSQYGERNSHEKFHQWWEQQGGGEWTEYAPTIMIWKNEWSYEGFCAVWFYPANRPQPPGSNVPLPTPPKKIQFVMEVFLKDGNGFQDQVITIRSPKYKFDYDSSAVYDSSTIQEATNPSNLDGNGPTHCHDIEVEQDPADILLKPNDDCECEVPNQNGVPYCDDDYEDYNNILDPALYRECLDGVNTKYRNDEFPVDDCRTRLEVPIPPEIFPNELITLQKRDERVRNKTRRLRIEDPANTVFEGCGLIKQCTSPFANDKVEEECIEKKSCPMIVTFGKGLAERHNSDEITIEIYAVSRGWAAVGISTDEIMGEDYVMECCKEGDQVNVYNSWNVKPTEEFGKRNIRFRGDQGVVDIRSSVIRPVRKLFFEDKLYCKFYLKKVFDKIDPDVGQRRDFDLDHKYFYILAFSNTLFHPFREPEGNLKSHIPNGLASEHGHKQILAGQRLSPLPNETIKYRAHGGFMIIGWMFFVTLTIFAARYYKETYVRFRLMKLPFWYLAHVMCAAFALVCLAAGTAIQIIATSGWRNLYRSDIHTYTGIVACCFFVLVFFLGFFLKKDPQAKRSLLGWVHVILGHLAYNLALLNLLLAPLVAYGFLTCQFYKYIGIWIAVYYVLHIMMSYHYCWVDYILGRSIVHGRSFNPGNIVTQGNYADTIREGGGQRRAFVRQARRLQELENERLGQSGENTVKEAPGRTIRTFALFYLILVSAVYTLWALRKMWSYAAHCYDFRELQAINKLKT